ncbi:MAG: hypothetical protein QOK19_765 [Solirubrobacteraceae bacterium]|jgi:hypothetical protein|nr:hypothetical protein [Solirubrobacteraceae bacterium]
MEPGRRLLLATCVGFGLIAAAAGSDFLLASFWARHALLTSLLANLLIVGVTVVVINGVIERRDRKRWSLLAQSVLFALTQSARATWTGLLELLEIGEVHSGTEQSLRESAELTKDTARIDRAARELLADEERRARLQRVIRALSEHASKVIADWAPVMVGARAYATVLDRHVELAGRLEWLSSVLAHNEPATEQSHRERNLARSNVATERAEQLGSDDWVREQILALITLGLELDEQSRAHAFSIVPVSWWAERTHELAAGED